QLADREGAMATLIAETGGLNAMIVDSTALPEQVVTDVMRSAFGSAGQRCSALRVLCVQEEIADRVIELIQGALQRLNVGDPALLSTDCGPVIDQNAYDQLTRYVQQQRQTKVVLGEATLPQNPPVPRLIAPVAIGINSLSELEREQFGPVLHILRYRADQLDQLMNEINAMGYGLTLGIHTRIQSRANAIAAKVRVGNCYINRNQIGAVVGVQPFGGRGLSGTGPKAGGPDYLKRFATEKVKTINTAAIGGNTSLLSQKED
ncbi:MAG: aldehyde dehydrogenase family protein, partial [Limnobacter sp.]|nr:aldehyde dehydrogenase family protein [Limnobacter sp.]